ncbi:MAG: diguanylate cyclase, partial [Frankiales bacterium]|nr:diguanylate cyclase [Frankiales bacterium]
MSRVATAVGDTVPVAERFRVTQWLRLGAVFLVVLLHVAAPETLAPDDGQLLPWTFTFCAVAVAAEVLLRVIPRQVILIFSGMLLVDGIWLAYGAYLTGGTTSPLRYLMLLQLGAVALLASSRTGVKLALWYSLLLVTMRNATARGLLPETAPPHLSGYGSADQRLAIFV